MATEEKIDALVGSSAKASTMNQSQRQRFYIELKPGETTIVSWKKLLREGKTIDQFPPTSTTETVMESTPYGTHCSSAHETPKRAKEDNSEGGQCCDPFVRNERLDHQRTSSSYHQLRKRSVELIEVEGEKIDHPSIEHVGLEDPSSWYSAKTSVVLDQPFTQSSVLTVIKDHHRSLPQSSEAYAPLVVYKKKLATFSSNSNYASPVNEMGTAPTFPLKSKQSGLQKTEKFSSGKSRMKGGLLGDPSDVMCQTSAGNCVPLQTNPRCRKLMNENDVEESFRNQSSGKGDKSGELLDVDSPGYNHPLQHSVSTKYDTIDVNVAKPAKPLNTVLEWAIRELEGTVAESTTFKIEAPDAHTSWLTIERELPLEVNLKLGEVARLMQSSEERMSEELVGRLVSILSKNSFAGKLVHGKTLKRLLRKFVMLKLSAKKDKVEKFKAIKNEILAMGQKSVESDGAVSPMAIDRSKTSGLLPSLKRKVTSGDSCYLTSPSSGRTFPMNATLYHSVVPPKTSNPLPKSVKQHSFPSERKLKSSVAHSPVAVGQQKQHVPEKNHVKLRLSLKPEDGTHRYKEQAAVNKFNCSRGDAYLTCKPSSFPG